MKNRSELCRTNETPVEISVVDRGFRNSTGSLRKLKAQGGVVPPQRNVKRIMEPMKLIFKGR